MKKRILTILAITTLTITFLVGCGSNNTDTTNENNINTQVETTEEPEIKEEPITTEEPTEEPTPEPALEYFETDETVNNFFVKYNEIATEKIEASQIQKGNIRTKALVYIDDFNMEVVSTSDILYISIGTAPENENTKLKDVFINCIKTMNTDLTDEEIETAWNDIHETGYMVEGYELNTTKINYVPYKELSSGHSNLRIDLEFSIN